MSVFALLAASPNLFIGTCLVLGLVVGSFLNVVIYRLPRHARASVARAVCRIHTPGSGRATTMPADSLEPLNLMVPRSACPSCKAPITALAERPAPLLARAARPLRALRHAHLGALPAGGALDRHSCQRGRRLEASALARRRSRRWSFTWFLIALTFIDVDHQLLPDSSDAAPALGSVSWSACAAARRPALASPWTCARA